MASKKFAKIALPVRLHTLFDYEIPNLYSPEVGVRVEVPFRKKRLVGIVVSCSDQCDLDPKKIRTIYDVLDKQPLINIELLTLCEWASQYYHYPIGEIVALTLPKRLREGKQLQVTAELFYQCTAKKDLIESVQLKNSPKKKKLLTKLFDKIATQNESVFSKEQLRALDFNDMFIRTFVKAGWLTLTDFEPYQPRKILEEKNKNLEKSLILNQDQQNCFEKIIDSINTFKVFLLEGVTGSGKTEIYLQAITKILVMGKQTLVLIPEINLTPQTISRFEKRFSEEIALLHSELSEKIRFKNWLLVQSGQAKIIIGTRSALLCPFKNLGLIIIDEEHDSSFKQQDKFRYSSRDLSIVLAKQIDCPIILGSATPSLESLYKATQGKYQHLQLLQRAKSQKLPVIKVIDCRRQKIVDGLSKQLRYEIQETLARQEQVILFINRRGFSPVLLCQVCGWHAICDRCNTKMTYHRAPYFLQCHLCLKQMGLPKVCPDCQGDQPLNALGVGTQRLEDAIKILFPKQSVLRIDRDKLPDQDSLNMALNQIHTQAPMVLIGTQLIAKGHHFSNVTLVGIIDVDAAFYSGEFRAIEQMAQLIIQVSGRAGRDQKPGQVLLQTTQPDNAYLQPLLKHDYHGLAINLLQERKQCHLPPFCFLAVIRAESHQREDAFYFLKQLLKNRWDQKTVEVIGPLALSKPKRAGYYRAEIIFRSYTRKALHSAVSSITTDLDPKLERLVRWHLEIDPLYLC